MNILYEPKLEMPIDSLPPDTYHENTESTPSDEFVVSRFRNGAVASTYGELTWNLSSYHPEEKPRILNFVYWAEGERNRQRDLLTHETRYLLFALIWLRSGSPLSIGTLRNYLTVANAIARYAETKSLTIMHILENEKSLWRFVEYQASGWATQTLGSLITQLKKCFPVNKPFNFIGENALQAIRTRGVKYRDTLNQHSPIPTRIYSTIIKELINELTEWEVVAEDMLAIIKACGDDPLTGRTPEVQKQTAKRLNIRYTNQPIFSQLASSKCLDYFAKKGKSANVKSLSILTAEIQLIAKLTIQTFTGMRDDEAISLPYHCIETTHIQGSTHHIILGRTTKFNNGRAKQTRWVTNAEGQKAIQAAQQIAEVIFDIFNIKINEITTRSNYHPLFPSVGYLAFASKPSPTTDDRLRPNKIDLSRMPNLRSRLQPIIEASDIEELENVDPHRAWTSEDKFQVGSPWSFTSHQLRRSLALYAQRSGLVSLPSLRRQLQHITDEMSRYYARGSIFAKDFIGNDKLHFGTMWQDTQAESAGLSYILNVLLSEEPLYGGHGAWVMTKHNDHGENTAIDRDSTLQRFKKGEIAYKETLLGGCTSTEPCKQTALKWINIECLENGCRNLVCKPSKLERVINAQEKLVTSLDKNSVEYRTEESDLHVLISARDKALKINLKIVDSNDDQ